jgi:hypothetical protein
MSDWASINQHLKTLRISQLTEWDVLTYIHSHGTNIASAERISTLLGYDKLQIGVALDSLTSTGLVERSRNFHGVRCYRIAPGFENDSRRYSFQALVEALKDRRGRLLLLRNLERSGAGRSRESSGLHLS